MTNPAVPPREGKSTLVADTRTLMSLAWRTDRRRVSLQVVLLLFNSLVGGVSLAMLIPIVNAVGNPDSSLEVPGFGKLNLAGIPLWVLLAAFLLLNAVTILIGRITAINTVSLQQEMIDGVRHTAFAAILDAKWVFVLDRRRSDIIEIVTNGAMRSGVAYNQLIALAITLTTLIVTTVIAFIVSPAVTGIALAGVLIIAIVQGASIPHAHRVGQLFSESSRRLYAVMNDSMESLRLVRAHNASAIWVGELADAFTDARELQMANVRRQSAIGSYTQFGLAAAAAGLVLVSVWLDVPPTGIVVLLLLAFRINNQMRSLVGTMAGLANSLPGVRDLASLQTAAEHNVEVPPGAVSARGDFRTEGEGALIEFRDVTFTYPRSENGVKGISFSVPRGQITVLTGHSGAGKSTTADITLGLLEPRSGAVLIDGEPLMPEDLRWWRANVAYVPQETVLVPGTLRRNLVWSVPGGASDEDCWEALDRAAASFARDLPEGLDTVLGERGIRLSGGERQRVAIARALLRRPALLVLDEATSSLDTETETEVLDLITSLVPAVTVLVIAHRQSTVDAAHHVVRFKAGRVVETVRR